MKVLTIEDLRSLIEEVLNEEKAPLSKGTVMDDLKGKINPGQKVVFRGRPIHAGQVDSMGPSAITLAMDVQGNGEMELVRFAPSAVLDALSTGRWQIKRFNRSTGEEVKATPKVTVKKEDD
jgi:hypothetical protein